jgi:pimeloyl-ACP methyl ester carboxylesterase
MSAITIEGDLVHYEVLGRGRPVVLIHGWLGSWRYWVPTLQQLQSKFRVYALDLLGFGDSSKNPQRYSVEHQLHMLSEFTQELGIPKTAMVGHGLGALFAAEFARRYADRVPRLILVSPPLFDTGDLDKRAPAARKIMAAVQQKAPQLEQDYAHNAPTILSPSAAMRAALAAYGQGGGGGRAAANSAPLLEPTLRRYEAPVFNPLLPLFRDTPLETLLARCFRRGEPSYDKLNADVAKTDLRALTTSADTYDAGGMLDTLWLLQMPTLVLHGGADKVIDAPNEAIQRHVTQEKETLLMPPPLPNVGHFPMLEDERFPRIVSDFLEMTDIRAEALAIRERWRRRTR